MHVHPSDGSCVKRRLLIRCLLTVVVSMTVFGPSRSADAQRPTGGMMLPTADVAASEGAGAIENNPAGVGFGPRFELAYTYVGARDDRPGEGHGVFLGIGALNPYHTALGLQFMELSSGARSNPTKVSWSHALQLGKMLSIGATWHTFAADDDPDLDGLDTWDLGLQLRPSRWIAAGLAITDLTTPKLGDNPTTRGYDMGVALRPGTEALTVSGMFRTDEDSETPHVMGGRVALELWGGFSLMGRYETTTVPEADDARVHRLIVGLTDQITGHLGMGLFGYTPDASADNRRNGLAVTARITSDAEPNVAIRRRPTVVEIEISGEIEEHKPTGFLNKDSETPFLDKLRTLHALAERDDVAAILLSVSDPKIGWARIAELRQALVRLQAHDKKIFAYLPLADTRAYAIAATADQIYTSPAGGVMLTGLRGETLYINQALGHLGIQAQFVAIGQYKSAPEMFTRQAPSDPAREVQNSMLDALYDPLLLAIAEGRKLPLNKIAQLVDEGPYTAEKAKLAKLVDGVIHYDEFERVMGEAFGGPVRFVPAETLLKQRDKRWGRQPEIAVLYAVGTITDGKSMSNPFTGTVTAGAETFIEATRALKENTNVAAVVLRVDSPGGSVTAADAMWRELKLLAKEKPLIVSMGDVAASGGYYIAAPGRHILAMPECITGSIGIFTGKFDLSKLYRTLGVHKEIYKRGARADLLSEARPWNDGELTVIRENIETLYRLFVERVAEGRAELDTKKVDAVAQGRVWTGAQAKARGLVDRDGGLMDAIELAAQEADLDADEYTLKIAPDLGGMGGLGGVGAAWTHGWLGEAIQNRLETVLDAHLPPALEPVRALLAIPMLHFSSGQPVALLPLVFPVPL